MPTGPRADLDQAHAHLFRHRAQLVARHRLQIRWGVDTLEDGHLEPDSGRPCYNEISDFRQLLRQQSSLSKAAQTVVDQRLRASTRAVHTKQRGVCALPKTASRPVALPSALVVEVTSSTSSMIWNASPMSRP